MNTKTFDFSGRTFSEKDIELIKWARKTYPTLSRRELTATVCEFLDWNTEAGKAKVIPCGKLLDKLEEDGVVKLPQKIKQNRRKLTIQEIEFDTTETVGKVSEYEPLHLSIARPGQDLKRWNSYINQYHMVGYKTVFGARLQYFVKSGEIELGCIQFSASAWALEERDKWIGWSKEDKTKRLNLIINNSRFLIFPWVRIKNLASKTFSLVRERIQQDWLNEYCYAPVLMETFVDLDNYKGTCYKASNWIYLGQTKGRGRMDRYSKAELSKKAIFVYPLQKDFKECLKGEKTYKKVNPDEC